MQDQIGDGYTILKLAGTKTDVIPLEKALRARSAPVNALECLTRSREISMVLIFS